MQTQIENQLKNLARDLIAAEDVQYIEQLFEGMYFTKDKVSVVGVYPNGSFVAETIDFEDLVRYVWYHTKYSNPRMLFIEGQLLNYNIDPKTEYKILKTRDKIMSEHAYVQFIYVPTTKMA